MLLNEQSAFFLTFFAKIDRTCSSNKFVRCCIMSSTRRSSKITLPKDATDEQLRQITNFRSRMIKSSNKGNQSRFNKAYNELEEFIKSVPGATLGPRLVVDNNVTTPTTVDRPVITMAMEVVKTEKILTLQRAILDLGDSAEAVLLQCGYMKGSNQQ